MSARWWVFVAMLLMFELGVEQVRKHRGVWY